MSDKIEAELELDSELLNYNEFQRLRNHEFEDVNRKFQDFVLNNHSKVLTHINKYLKEDGYKAQVIYLDPLVTGSYYVASGGHQLATEQVPFKVKYIDYIVGLFKNAGYEVNEQGQLLLDNK